MTNDINQIAVAFKAAGEALLELGQLFAKHGTGDIIGKSESSTSRRKRVIKDKNAPKKNYSSYLHFCDEQRPLFAKEHPSFTQPELAKLLGEKWMALSGEDKEPYQKIANQDKKRYDQEMANYTPDVNNLTSVADKKVKSKSTKHAVAATTAAPEPEAVVDTTASTAEKTSGDKEKKKKKKNKKNHKNKQ